jgi:hypothetical protein
MEEASELPGTATRTGECGGGPMSTKEAAEAALSSGGATSGGATAAAAASSAAVKTVDQFPAFLPQPDRQTKTEPHIEP